MTAGTVANPVDPVGGSRLGPEGLPWMASSSLPLVSSTRIWMFAGSATAAIGVSRPASPSVSIAAIAAGTPIVLVA